MRRLRILSLSLSLSSLYPFVSTQDWSEHCGGYLLPLTLCLCLLLFLSPAYLSLSLAVTRLTKPGWHDRSWVAMVTVPLVYGGSGDGCLLLWFISVGGKCRYSYLSSGLFIHKYLYNKVKYLPPVVSYPGKLLLWNRFFKDNSSLFLTKQRMELCYYSVIKYLLKDTHRQEMNSYSTQVLHVTLFSKNGIFTADKMNCPA